MAMTKPKIPLCVSCSGTLHRHVKGCNSTPVPKEIGEYHFLLVKEFFTKHLCATQVECAEHLNLSPVSVNRHVKRIRSSWRT